MGRRSSPGDARDVFENNHLIGGPSSQWIESISSLEASSRTCILALGQAGQSSHTVGTPDLPVSAGRGCSLDTDREHCLQNTFDVRMTAAPWCAPTLSPNRCGRVQGTTVDPPETNVNSGRFLSSPFFVARADDEDEIHTHLESPTRPFDFEPLLFPPGFLASRKPSSFEKRQVFWKA